MTANATATRTFSIDKTHSEAAFQVRHLLTKVRGRFTEFSGTIRFNPDRPEDGSVNFTIDANSIDTNTADRDKHLRSEDFFFVEQHPHITFLSSKVTGNGAGAFDVEGTLTIRGVAKQITLPVAYLGEAKDPYGQQKVGFEVETTINRKDYGLHWNAALETGGFLVGDDVKITLTVQAVAQ